MYMNAHGLHAGGRDVPNTDGLCELGAQSRRMKGGGGGTNPQCDKKKKKTSKNLFAQLFQFKEAKIASLHDGAWGLKMFPVALQLPLPPFNPPTP